MFSEFRKQEFSGKVILSENSAFFVVIEESDVNQKKIELFQLSHETAINRPALNPTRSLGVFAIPHGNIDKLKVSNNGQFLFYLQCDIENDTILEKSLYYLDLRLSNTVPQLLFSAPYDVPYNIDDYIISSNGLFLAIKINVKSMIAGGFRLIFSEPCINVVAVNVLEKKCICEIRSCSAFSFFSEDTLIYSQMDFLYKVQLSKFKNPGEDHREVVLNPEHSKGFLSNMPPKCSLVVHANKSLLLFISNYWMNPSISFYDIDSNQFNRVPIPYFRSLLNTFYVAGERLLCLMRSEAFLGSTGSSAGKFQLGIIELKDGKGKRPITIPCPAESCNSIGVISNFSFAAISSGNSLYFIQLPLPSPRAKQYFFQQNHLTLSGEELLRQGYDAFKKILRDIEGYRNIIFTNSKIRIQTGKDWLLTAGHLSAYPTSIDQKLSGKWYPATVELVNPSSTVQLKNSRGGEAFVEFPGLDGSYVAISNKLMKMTKIEPDPNEIEKIISALLRNENFKTNNPPNHSEIAKVLLNRLGGKAYPADYAPDQKTFFDCLLVLMFGVEGSRNNLTFLTGVMLLDLIASNTNYGRKGHQYNWNNAFVSGPEFHWNDYENKNYGGKFPMATNSTGTGNFTERRNAIQGNSSSTSHDLQRERVQVREMSIIVHWLQAFSQKESSYFSGELSENALKDKVRKLFERRLRGAYLEEPCLDFLPYHEPNGGGHSQLKRHYKDEPFVFYLQHKAKDKSTSIDKHYHRTDYPCKTVPGFALNGKTKTVKALETEITSEIIIKKKVRTKITRKNIQFLELLKNMPAVPDVRLKGKLVRLFSEYNKWLISYFDPAAFSFIEDGIFNSVLRQNNVISVDEVTKKYVLENLKWEFISNNSVSISREQIIRLATFAFDRFDISYQYQKNRPKIEDKFKIALYEFPMIIQDDEGLWVYHYQDTGRNQITSKKLSLPLAEQLVKELEFKPEVDVIESLKLSALVVENLKKELEENNFIKPRYCSSRSGLDLMAYADQFIKALQCVMDPLIDFDQRKLPVNLRIFLPDDEKKEEKINALLLVSDMILTTEIKLILNSLFHWNPGSRFEVCFDLAQEPCSACYSEFSEPYPSLAYNHNSVVCLYHESLPAYHRIDKSCEQISYEADNHIFREEPGNCDIRILEELQKEPDNLLPGTYILRKSGNFKIYLLGGENLNPEKFIENEFEAAVLRENGVFKIFYKKTGFDSNSQLEINEYVVSENEGKKLFDFFLKQEFNGKILEKNNYRDIYRHIFEEVLRVAFFRSHAVKEWSFFYIDNNRNRRSIKIEDINELKESLSKPHISDNSTDLKNKIKTYHRGKYLPIELKPMFVQGAAEAHKVPCAHCWLKLTPEKSYVQPPVASRNQNFPGQIALSGRDSVTSITVSQGAQVERLNQQLTGNAHLTQPIQALPGTILQFSQNTLTTQEATQSNPGIADSKKRTAGEMLGLE